MQQLLMKDLSSFGIKICFVSPGKGGKEGLLVMLRVLFLHPLTQLSIQERNVVKKLFCPPVDQRA